MFDRERSPGVMRQLWSLLERPQRQGLLAVLIAELASGALQTVGVGSVMPFVSALTRPAEARSGTISHLVAQLLGIADRPTTLWMFGVAIVVLLVAGNAAGALAQYAVIRFSAVAQYRLVTRLFEEYLGRPYSFFIETNSSELSQNLLTEVTRAVTLVLMPLLNAIAGGLVALSIVVFLLIVSPLVAVAAGGILGGSYALIYLFIHKRMVRLGRDRLEAGRGLYRSSAEAFAAVKELKLHHAEEAMTIAFGDAARQYAERDAANASTNRLPRFVLESLAFGGVVALLLVLLRGGSQFATGVPLITMYIFAGYKLLPALQALFQGFGQARFGAPTVDLLYSDLSGCHSNSEGTANPGGTAGIRQSAAGSLPTCQTNRPPPSGAPSIALEGVSFTYPARTSPALTEITLTVGPNQMTGIVGRTGSGKTTLVDVITGLLQPDAGMITIDGSPLTTDRLGGWQRRIGYVPQTIGLIDASIARNVAFATEAEEISSDRLEWACRLAALDEFVRTELPQGYMTPVGERGVRLSGGQRQRIGIARALYRNPDLLVLDEATNALDRRTEELVIGNIRDEGQQRTIIIIAHRIQTVSECDWIHVIDAGRCIDGGSYEELLGRSPTFDAATE